MRGRAFVKKQTKMAKKTTTKKKGKYKVLKSMAPLGFPYDARQTASFEVNQAKELIEAGYLEK